MKIWRLPSAFSTRRLISAIRSFEPGGGRGLQNFSHSSSGARSAKDDDGITNGPGVAETIRPSKMEISQAVAPTSSRKVVDRNRPRLTSASSPLTRSLSVSIIPSPPGIIGQAARRSLVSFALHDGGMGRGVNRLEPGAYQGQIGRAGREQRDGQRDMHARAGGLKGRSHDPQNIRRFYPGSLDQYFSRDSGLVYDSGTPDLKGTKNRRIGRPSGLTWP